MIKANFEIWKDIKGYEGCYQISTWGRVRSLDRFIKCKLSHTGRCIKKGKLLSIGYNKDGYIQYFLSKNSCTKTNLVHRLVAEAFVPNPNNFPEVNHKDEDKTNNRVDNLEWCTREYNVNYGTMIERVKKANTNGKCSKILYQYNLNGNLIKVWPSVSEAGRNGFNRTAILNVCSGLSQTHKKFIWSYKEL